LGIPGLVLYVLVFTLLIKRLFSSAKMLSNKDYKMARLGAMVVHALLGVVLVALFQENSMGPQAGGLYFLTAGIVDGLARKKSR